MAYVFERKPTASFKFKTNQHSSEQTTLQGINATVESAAMICNAVDSLMAIGGNTPYYVEGTRTVNDVVNDY